ncbi:hypothetical protein GCM10027073_05770 [Streptomyces chlorus]
MPTTPPDAFRREVPGQKDVTAEPRTIGGSAAKSVQDTPGYEEISHEWGITDGPNDPAAVDHPTTGRSGVTQARATRSA